jgi:hypothetical protein
VTTYYNFDQLGVTQFKESTFSISYIFSDLPPGQYYFGMAGRDTFQPERWDNSGYGFLSVLVFE